MKTIIRETVAIKAKSKRLFQVKLGQLSIRKQQSGPALRFKKFKDQKWLSKPRLKNLSY